MFPLHASFKNPPFTFFFFFFPPLLLVLPNPQKILSSPQKTLKGSSFLLFFLSRFFLLPPYSLSPFLLTASPHFSLFFFSSPFSFLFGSSLTSPSSTSHVLWESGEVGDICGCVGDPMSPTFDFYFDFVYLFFIFFIYLFYFYFFLFFCFFNYKINKK